MIPKKSALNFVTSHYFTDFCTGLWQPPTTKFWTRSKKWRKSPRDLPRILETSPKTVFRLHFHPKMNHYVIPWVFIPNTVVYFEWLTISSFVNLLYRDSFAGSKSAFWTEEISTSSGLRTSTSCFTGSSWFS